MEKLRNVAILIIFVTAIRTEAFAQPVAVRSGDLVICRNDDTVGNPNGYFNHVAILVNTDKGISVVEMQRDFDGCIAVDGPSFFRRYPEYCVVRHDDPGKAYAAARFAWSQVGGPRYGLAASLKPCIKIGNKDNCVSLVRRCYVASGLHDPRWIKPDGVYHCGFGFRRVAHYRYKDYKIPDNFFEGLLP